MLNSVRFAETRPAAASPLPGSLQITSLSSFFLLLSPSFLTTILDQKKMSRLTFCTMLHLFSNSNTLWATTRSHGPASSVAAFLQEGPRSSDEHLRPTDPATAPHQELSPWEQGRGATESTEVMEKFWIFLPLSSDVANLWLSKHCWLDQKQEASAISHVCFAEVSCLFSDPEKVAFWNCFLLS